MKPLKPDDLLMRTSPVELERWGKGVDATGEPVSPIRLERFQELEQTLRNNPVHAAPYVELARIYLQQERWNDAKRVLDRAASQFEHDDTVLTLREEAQLARSLHLLSHAEAEYKAAPNVLNEAELTRSRLDLNAMREKVCRARLQRHPERLELTLPLAEALDGLDRSHEAIESLKLAASDPELRAAASLKLGEIYEKHRHVTDALSAYRQAALFRVPPPSPSIQLTALSRAADLASREGLLDSARRYLEMLQKLEPQNPRWQQLHQSLAKLPDSPAT